MNTASKVIIGFLLAVIVFLFIRSCTFEKRWQNEVSWNEAFLDSLTNATPQVDTQYIERVKRDTTTLWRRVEVVRVDTVECPRKVYTGVYKSDLLSVRWRISLFGELDRVDILPGSSYRFKEITIQKTVLIPQRPDVSVNMGKLRSHLYFIADAGFYPDFGNFGAGLMWVHKRGFGIQAKMYVSNKITFGGGLVVRIL